MNEGFDSPTRYKVQLAPELLRLEVRNNVSDFFIYIIWYKNVQSFEMLLYSAPEGKTHIEVFFEEETFWLSQKKMAELFGINVRTISERLQNIFKTRELLPDSTVRKFRIVQKEGSREVSREVDFYNLGAIIAVGYRINSHEATRFRIWSIKFFVIILLKALFSTMSA